MCDVSMMEFNPNDSQVGDIENPFEELFNAVVDVTQPIDDMDSIAISYPANLAIKELNTRLEKHSLKKGKA